MKLTYPGHPMKRLSVGLQINPLIGVLPYGQGTPLLPQFELEDMPSGQGSNFLTKSNTMSASQHLTPQSGRAPMWPGFLMGQPEQPVRVLLIEDDPHMARVIANELLADLRINLLGRGSNVREGYRLISQNEFDVMLVDLDFGDGTGFDLIEYMKTVRPQAEAVAISATEDEQQALHAFELGATGYLVKDSWFGNFSQAVLQVVNGGASITPSLTRRLLNRLAHPQVEGFTLHKDKSQCKLSEREKEVLKLVASGHVSAEIGLRLNISGQTVNTHIKHICSKLNVHTRAQAVSYAVNRGLFG